MYSFSITMDQPVDAAIEKLTQALSEEKLGIVSDINVAAIMKKKLDLDVPPYRILGACAPGLAKRVLDAEPEAGALLPCNIIVRETGEAKTSVDFMDPVSVLGLTDNPTINDVASEARAILKRVSDKL